jgi:hypothetical protein
MQFIERQEAPSFVSTLSPTGARALAKELLAAAVIAEETRGAA